MSRPRPARAGVLVITSDRGMCGGYNTKVLQATERLLQVLRDEDNVPALYVMGRKGLQFFSFRGLDVAESWTGFSQKPVYADTAEVSDHAMLPKFVRTRIYSELLNSALAEPAARCTAMKAATDSADDLVMSLRHWINHARQAQITRGDQRDHQRRERTGGPDATSGSATRPFYAGADSRPKDPAEAHPEAA